MEVLSRPANAPRVYPRVISNASMTMKFHLPDSLRQELAALSIDVRKDRKSVENDDENVVEDSWESRDWETEAASASCVRNVEKEQTVDGWEHESIPDLPDDFPRLLVNLTRVQRQHFPATKQEEDFDVMEVFHRVKNTLHQHFSQLVEVFFEQKLCFHCTYGTSRAMMDSLHAAYPDDVFAMVDYPTEIDDVPLHEYMHTLSYPSKWKSVEYLKDCLRQCSRDIRWKRDVVTELELLAEQEFAQYEAKQQELGDEIDELTRLRDSFREKLEKMASQERKPKGQYLMLRKLEDIENRLMTLLDAFLQEPELREEECYSAFGGREGEVTTDMNVLDMVIAMVFGRLPRDFSQRTTTEEHFQMLFDYHIHILRLWKKDFGRLPPKSRMALQNASGSEAGSAHVSSDEERGDGYDENDVAIRVNDDQMRNSNEDYDEWERAQETTGRDAGQPIDGKTHHDDDSDGYSADFDSDESKDDSDEANQVQAQQLKTSDAETMSASTRSRRRRTKHTRRSKKLQKSKVERHGIDNEKDVAPFQPFACTGAVSLLRLAKEQETF